jgi:hypothetical protein
MPAQILTRAALGGSMPPARQGANDSHSAAERLSTANVSAR